MTKATASPKVDRTIRLQDGRQMAYCEWGDLEVEQDPAVPDDAADDRATGQADPDRKRQLVGHSPIGHLGEDRPPEGDGGPGVVRARLR